MGLSKTVASLLVFPLVALHASQYRGQSQFDKIMSQIQQLDPKEKDLEDTCDVHYRPFRLGIRHIEPEGIGYDHGYSTIEVFAAPGYHKLVLPFFDVRAHRLTNGRFAMNAGLGVRYELEEAGWVLGANFFYDYRRFLEKNFNQLGGGLEALGKYWNYRINGYFPVGNREKIRDINFKRFSGHRVLLKQTSSIAMRGGDFEIERRLPSWMSADFYVGAGPYFYSNPGGRNALGVKGRLYTIVSDVVKLGARASYDKLFRFKFQGEVGLQVPLGKKEKGKKYPHLSCANQEYMAKRLVLSVERQEIIPIVKIKTCLTARDAVTGKPLTFVHVNNLAGSGGDGTVEAPFNTLLLAQNNSNPGDFIYVNRGDGSTLNMNAGITLSNDQKLFGAGIAQEIATTKGGIFIPPHSSDFPSITNTAGIGVTLGNGNVVSGMRIISTTSDGISWSGNTRAPSIVNNEITGTGTGGSAAGIDITVTTGTAVAGTFVIAGNTISSSETLHDAIQFSLSGASAGTSVTVDIRDNDLLENGDNGIHFLLTPIGNSVAINGSITNNTVSGNLDHGIEFEMSPPTAGTAGFNFTLSVTDNFIAASGDEGFMANRASGTLTFSRNVVTDNGPFGITGMSIEADTPDSLTLPFVGNRIIANNETFGVEIESNNAATINLHFIDNFVQDDTILFDVNGGATLNVRMSGNTGTLTSDTFNLIP